jgi:hypothetical protein
MATVGIECVGWMCLVHKRGKSDCKKIPNPRLEMTLALQKSRQAPPLVPPHVNFLFDLQFTLIVYHHGARSVC